MVLFGGDYCGTRAVTGRNQDVRPNMAGVRLSSPQPSCPPPWDRGGHSPPLESCGSSSLPALAGVWHWLFPMLVCLIVVLLSLPINQTKDLFRCFCAILLPLLWHSCLNLLSKFSVVCFGLFVCFLLLCSSLFWLLLIVFIGYMYCKYLLVCTCLFTSLWCLLMSKIF